MIFQIETFRLNKKIVEIFQIIYLKFKSNKNYKNKTFRNKIYNYNSKLNIHNNLICIKIKNENNYC